MICDICGKHEASVFIRRIMDKNIKELSVCVSCAQEHHLYGNDQELNSSLNTVFENILSHAHNREAVRKGKCRPVCPACGTSLEQVQKEGRIGCPMCFFYFRDTVLKKIGAVNSELFYLGNLPEQLETFSDVRVPVQHLQKELEKAVESENYELAAYFRDRIKEAESYS